MIEVELPDGSIAEFPDGTNPGVMAAALQKHKTGVSKDVENPYLTKAKAVGETALALGSGMASQVPAAIGGLLSGVNDVTQGRFPKSIGSAYEGITNALTYEPRTDAGKDMTEDVARSGFMQSLNAVGGHVIPPVLTKPRMPKAGPLPPVDVGVLKNPEPNVPQPRVPEQTELPLETTVQQIAERRGAEVGQRDMFGPVNEELGRPDMGEPIGPKPVPEPIDTMRQHELFDQPEQGRVANPYEAVTGDWRVDENGMPIKVDLSMDVANAENPLQRNLWGDELPRKHQQEGTPLTEAIDSMPNPPWESPRSQGIDMLSGELKPTGDLLAAKMELEGWNIPKSQRGGIDMSVFDPAFEKIKEVANNIRLIMKGGEDGPTILAIRNGKEIGTLKLGADNFVNPTPDSNLVPNWVGVVPKEQRKGIASAMYDMAGEHGDVIPSKVQTAEGRAFRQARGQRGAIDIKAIEAGIKGMAGQLSSMTSKMLPMVAKAPIANSMETPTLPATILKKNELRTKVEASALLKKLAPEYSTINTIEEARFLAKDAEDINKNVVRDANISGINGLTMLKRDNPALNYTRGQLQEYRNTATKFSKDFITSPDGVATTYAKLKGQDRVQAVEVLREAAVAQIEITADNIKRLGLKPEQEAYILSVRRMAGAMWDMAADSLQMAGRNAFEKRAGYLPNMFTGSYKTLLGEMKDGVFVTREIIQSDTRYGHKAALDAAMAENPKLVAKTLPRVGLQRAKQRSNLFNGFNDIMNVIAKNDPRFAELQMAAQMKINEANHSLMNFDVHEMHKKGIRGAVGDNRFISREQNAADLGRAIIDYGEQGADYYASQKALNNIGELITSPEMEHMPNTIATISNHVKHVTGQNLYDLGSTMNGGLDLVFNAVGISPKAPLTIARGLKTGMGLHMMSIFNPIFTALQWTQPFTSALPEALKVGGKLGVDVSASMVSAPSTLAMLVYGKQKGIDVPVAPHQKAAYQYMLDHGITTFSELEIAHTATRNQTLVKAETLAAWNIAYGEKFTRPPVFMAFADIFHKFGLSDNEAFMAAQHTTNMAMGDYHPHERPKIYAGLGVLGEFGGALTTFKHNAISNIAIKSRDALLPDKNGKRTITPALAVIAAAAFFQGIAGMPGFDEADAAYQWATEKMGKRQGITETALKQVPDWGKYGYLSASTGLDFHSRLSMSKALPEMSGAALSPQLAALADIGLKAYTYGKFKDEQSYKDFVRSITPSGLKGAVEDSMMTDKDGFVENPAGELMNAQPRTDKERLIRKVFSVKPLRESVESKDVYIDSQQVKANDEARNKIAIRFRQAYASGDQKGMDNLAQMYYDKEGTLDTLMAEEAIKNQMVRSNQSQRERMTGKLEATMKSINRYRDMNDGN